MKTTYRVEGMHCHGCASTVAEALRSVQAVRAADVSFESRTATVESEGAIAMESLNDAVSNRGDYQLRSAVEQESAASAQSRDAAAEPAQEQESLYPLFLIVGYILGTVLLIAWATDNWSLEPMMRHFMAGFFIVFSFFKLLDLPGFVSAYRDYDLVARASSGWAWIYPFVELALGIAYLLAFLPILTNLVTFIVMTVGAVGVLMALIDKRRIRCACLGTALNLPMTKVTLVEDLTMAAMAGAMLIMLWA